MSAIYSASGVMNAIYLVICRDAHNMAKLLVIDQCDTVAAAQARIESVYRAGAETECFIARVIKSATVNRQIDVTFTDVPCERDE